MILKFFISVDKNNLNNVYSHIQIINVERNSLVLLCDVDSVECVYQSCWTSWAKDWDDTCSKKRMVSLVYMRPVSQSILNESAIMFSFCCFFSFWFSKGNIQTSISNWLQSLEKGNNIAPLLYLWKGLG